MAFQIENKFSFSKRSPFSQKIEFLTALSLFFSYTEMLLPRFMPFFKLGLANVVILCALDFDFFSFLFLIFVKTVTSGIFNGTLFSPFFVISVFQSFISGICMFFLQKINFALKNKFCSVYGVSIFGSSVSNFVQILMCSFYLGKGTFSLLAPMLIFSILSGFLTGFLCQFVHIPQNFADLKIISKEKNSFDEQKVQITENKKNIKSRLKKSHFFGIFVLSLCVFVFFLKNIVFALIFMIFAFLLQIMFGRKIKILPHISVWFFVIVFSLFIPNGKVLFKIGNFSVTQGSLFTGILKAAKLSAAASFSQTIMVLDFVFKKSVFLQNVKTYFYAIIKTFQKLPGNIFKRLKNTLENPIC